MARHRAERPLSAAHVGMALLPVLAAVMVALAVQSAAVPAHPAPLSGPRAHTATHPAAGQLPPQSWPVVTTAPQPIHIDAVTASR